MNQIFIDDKIFFWNLTLGPVIVMEWMSMSLNWHRCHYFQEQSLLKDFVIIMKINKLSDIKINGNLKTIYEPMKNLI